MRKLSCAVFVLGVAAALRCLWLSNQVFWHDEVYTQIFVSGFRSSDWQSALFTGEALPVSEWTRFRTTAPDSSMWGIMSALAGDEPQHPPLYYLLARLWVGLFGNTELVLRSLSVVCSLFALPAMYWLGRELFAEKRAAIGAALLLAVSPFFVLYAREAREYALWSVMLLLSCASLLRAIRLEKEGATLKPWLLFSLLTAAALYTSFSTLSLVLAQTMFLCVGRHGRAVLMRGIGALTFALCCFSPWAFLLAKNFGAFLASMAWSSEITVPTAELLSTFVLNVARPITDFSTIATPVTVGVISCIVALALLGAFAYVAIDKKKKSRFLILLFVVPIAMHLGPDLLLGGIRSLSSRYLTLSWLAVILVTSYGLTRLQNPRPKLAVMVLLVASLSSWLNDRSATSWSKSLSNSLPRVAQIVNESDRPLLVANWERHHPGNLHALSALLKPQSSIQVPRNHEGYLLPQGYDDVFLFGVNPQFREHLRSQGLAVTPIVEDVHVELWQVSVR